MDKKRPIKSQPQAPEDLRGFEEFIEGQSGDSSFLPKQNKKEASFEHFTFLTNDSERLVRVKDLIMDKLPFIAKYEQGAQIINEQKNEIALLRKNLFEVCNKPGSPYRRSLAEIFDSFFEPPKT